MVARIAIVGGGPGGSSFALYLVRAGVDPSDIVLYDRAVFPRPKLCGGGITFRGTTLLHDLVGVRPTGGGEARGLDFRCALGRFPVLERGPQWLYDRGVLDAQLLEAVRGTGVAVREGASVDAVEASSEGWRLRTGGVTESHAWVVGADGARSFVRREAGLPGGRLGRLVEGVFEHEGEEPDRSLLQFDFDPILDGIPGYAWAFPLPGAPRRWKLGVMDGRGTVPGERLRRWTMDYARRLGFRFVESKLAGWPEHYYAFRAKSHRPGLLLTGEAFGIDPLLGEGITPAIEISRYAARRLKSALDAGRRSIPFYEAGYLATADGRNLLYQALLADRIYGRHPYRWLRVLFENEALHAMAASGESSYGQLTTRSPRLVLAFVARALRHGIPSNAPIVRPALPAEVSSLRPDA